MKIKAQAIGSQMALEIDDNTHILDRGQVHDLCGLLQTWNGGNLIVNGGSTYEIHPDDVAELRNAVRNAFSEIVAFIHCNERRELA